MIPLFITNLIQDKKVPVYGRGENIRDWIHVDDHNEGVEYIIKKGVIGQTYCLGGENEIRNIDLTKMILELMDKNEVMIEYVPDRAGHDFRYAMNISKARNELDWKPKIDFKKGLADTIKWYAENKEWWQPLVKKIS
jgi:dTDP-glucose 4,6-dehydratase